mmetsp:Transcript_356/g.819  ORF Transcript_356/g.819 Transcript_356/m.819 type:complete len:150 (+) Transcript_356:121-570(+)
MSLSSRGRASETVRFPTDAGYQSTLLVGVYFRDGAKEMVKSWTEGYLGAHGQCSDLKVLEVSCVESLVFRWAPLQKVLVQGLVKNAKQDVEYLASFGNASGMMRRLDVSNRMTAYCFLVDCRGNVRWRGSGKATDKELDIIHACVERLK